MARDFRRRRPGECIQGPRSLAALISFSLNAAAYCAEIVRAAIQSINKGQSEAAKALGMTYGQDYAAHRHPPVHPADDPPRCATYS